LVSYYNNMSRLGI